MSQIVLYYTSDDNVKIPQTHLHTCTYAQILYMALSAT